MSYIIVNDRAMHLDQEARKNGYVRVAENSMNLECEETDCGADLTESGILHKNTIFCESCESTYRIID